MLPYGIIVTCAAVVLALRYLRLPEASIRSKSLIGGGVAASLLIPWFFPRGYLVGFLLQLAISMYVLIFLKLTSDAP